MNLNLTALKASLLILITIYTCNIAKGTTPTDELPPIDAELSQLLIEGMGGLMNDNPDYPTFTDEHYKARFLELSGLIQYKLTATIKNHIIHRTERYRSATERTLGLTEMYFPVFEEYLALKNVPHHLKYLPIVESNLNPVAASHAAAVGLWQFIPGTGKLYGLKIASYLDERSDTHKASKAAATMLSQLYKRYGDWPLALAAYNCGPGRIDKLVRGTNKNYWDIQKYLPKETQRYVPYFMAVAYSYEFHYLHELTPKRLPSDLILTDSIHLTPGYKTLADLSKKYKISKDTLKQLNPAYLKNYVPASCKNPILILPARIVAKARNYEEDYNKIMSMKTENPIKCLRRVDTEAELAFLMKAHRFSRNDLLFWNGLPSNYRVQTGDLIAVRKYHVPKDAFKKQERKTIKRISIASLQVVGLDDRQEKALTAPVYVTTVKALKLVDKVSNSALLANTNSSETNFGLAANRSAQKVQKQETIAKVSQDRSRRRRLRSYNATNTSRATSTAPVAVAPVDYKKPQMLAAKAISKQTTAQEDTKRKAENAKLYQAAKERAAQEKTTQKATASKAVTQLSRAIQSKEQAVVRANAYSKTSAEEVSTLSTLHKESGKLKKERLAKEK
jgi:membrane-bound lytic murein transglycosylase D